MLRLSPKVFTLHFRLCYRSVRFSPAVGTMIICYYSGCVQSSEGIYTSEALLIVRPNLSNHARVHTHALSLSLIHTHLDI